jgi:hypothetical protein
MWHSHWLLEWASAAYTLAQLEHENGEGGSTSARQCVRVVKETNPPDVNLVLLQL